MSKWISGTLLIGVAGAWSAIMVVVGALLVTDWPARFGWQTGYWELAGAALVAAGQFVFAFAAARFFPLANRKVTIAFESLPWVGFVILVLGGRLW